MIIPFELLLYWENLHLPIEFIRAGWKLYSLQFHSEISQNIPSLPRKARSNNHQTDPRILGPFKFIIIGENLTNIRTVKVSILYFNKEIISTFILELQINPPPSIMGGDLPLNKK